MGDLGRLFQNNDSQFQLPENNVIGIFFLQSEIYYVLKDLQIQIGSIKWKDNKFNTRNNLP